MSERMVIVGAGQAGGRAALTLREQGFAGSVVLLGQEPAAPYERPPLSKAFLKGERDAAGCTFATAEALAGAGVDFRPATAVLALDRVRRVVRLADGGELAYDRLLLATGREPRRLVFADGLGGHVHELRDLADATRLRACLVPGARLVIIGGGFIGLEVAASAAELGVRVSVLEALPRLLSRAVPEPLAAVLRERHERAGVEISLGCRIAAIAPAAAGVTVELEGDKKTEADAVLVGIGAVPRAGLAEVAGLAVDNGILVDETLATSDPDIFAAGDVCAVPHPLAGERLRLEAWRNADAQGALAARNMLGSGLRFEELPWFWSDQYELTLQVAGYPDRAATTVERDVGPDARLLIHLAADGTVIGASGVGPASAAKEFKLAQLLAERRVRADPVALASPETRLRSLLR